MLKVHEVSMAYGDFVAVKKVSFTIKPGEIFGLLGTNGAGKTTTFRMIMGLLKPRAGYVTFFDESVSYEHVNQIGYMIEERSLLTKITVKDLILYFGQLKDMNKEDILTRLDYWLKRFDIESYKLKKIKELSKGNQQKIQFIASVINNPKLLILDEPFSGLDPINTMLFVEAIKDFQKQGTMVVFSSHQLDRVEAFCENIVVLEKGEVILEGPIKDIKRKYQKLNIKVIAEGLDIDAIQALEGVIEVTNDRQSITVKVASENYVSDVFNIVSKATKVLTFDVMEPALSEIFISKVRGAKNEKA
jgi:ABC-2 type transport system ATP-binding protein